MILSPASQQTNTIARVFYSGNLLLCKFKETNDQFRKLIKKHGLSWNNEHTAWSRSINQDISGSLLDRAAELSAQLINHGFACEVSDQVAQLVQSAGWQPEHLRWVQAFDGSFHLRWRKSTDENLYSRAMTLPGASYDHIKGTVCVPALYFSEVEGFAEEHDFRFTNTANGLLENARRDFRRVIIPEALAPTAKKKYKPAIKDLHIDKFADLPDRHLQTVTDLFPHQVPAVEKILPMRVGALFMDMGTGKTRCAIELVARRQQRISRVVWFCPVSLKTTIAAEIAKHTKGEDIYVFNGNIKIDDLRKSFWYVVGIESMSSSDYTVLAVQALIDSDTFVIVDESSYIKGHASKRSMRISYLSAQAKYRLLLTGTPITQGVEDLYSQMYFLSPDILGYGSFYQFSKNHLEYSDKYPGMIVKALHVGQIADRIAPFTYQITKDECLDLPEKIYDHFYFGLTEEQLEAYEQAKEEIISGILDEIPDYIIFQLFTALQQIVSGFWNRNGNEFISFHHKRIETLLSVIGEIPENEKVIIWCKYTESVRQISDALAGCALYYGDLSEKERDVQLQSFRGPSRFLVATMATGGHGLTLNEARYHIFYENEFKYSHRVQAEDRSHRIGQTRSVTYIDIVSNSGIDRRIHAALSKKEDVVKSFRREVNERKGKIDL